MNTSAGEDVYVMIAVAFFDWDLVRSEFAAVRELFSDLKEEDPYPELPNFSERFKKQQGSLLICNWSKNQVVAQLQLPLPHGFSLVGSDQILVSCWSSSDIKLLSPAGSRSFHTPFLNHPHSVEPRYASKNDTFLIPSSGTDWLFEMNLQGEILWSWYAFEHGYDKHPCGVKARYDKQADYREKKTGTQSQTTHVNSAIVARDGSILAVLPSHGQVVQINKQSGEFKVVVDGLSYPHDLQHTKHGKGYMICDTRARQVIFFNEKFEKTRTLPVEGAWIQDCIMSERDESYFAVINRDVFAKEEKDFSNRITQFNQAGQAVKTLHFLPTHRLSQVSLMTAEQVQYWSELWNKDEKGKAALDATAQMLRWQDS